MVVRPQATRYGQTGSAGVSNHPGTPKTEREIDKFLIREQVTPPWLGGYTSTGEGSDKDCLREHLQAREKYLLFTLCL